MGHRIGTEDAISDFKRYFVPGGTYFLTLVTYRRQRILTTDDGRRLLRRAIGNIRETRPFTIVATVLLPDHWHLVLTLPQGDSDYSTRIKRIKEHFTLEWHQHCLPEAPVTASQKKRGERGVWQPRFWEHTVTDENDLERCVDYIHWNPRKHECVTRVRDWRWSSFHRFVNAGQYSIDWGGTVPSTIKTSRHWGE